MFSFFRTPKHQKFEYLPRYWDPEKEELEARMKRNKKTSKNDAEAIKTRISSSFKARYSPDARKRARSAMRTSTLRMIIFVVLLFVAILFLGEKIAKFVQIFEGSGSTI